MNTKLTTDDLLELEDYCAFCSKNLLAMHDQQKMHYNTCKLRQLLDSVYSSTEAAANDMNDFIMIGDNCTSFNLSHRR
jgi:hypothetical protein